MSGSGVGALALALLARWPDARADLVEIDPASAALARGERGAERDGGSQAVCSSSTCSTPSRVAPPGS